MTALKPGDIVVPLPSLYWGPDAWTGREMMVLGVSRSGDDALLAWPHHGPIHTSDEVVAINVHRLELVRAGSPERALVAAWCRYVERLDGDVRRPRPDAWTRRKNERRARDVLAAGVGDLDTADLVYLTGLTAKALGKLDVPGKVTLEKGAVVFEASAELRAWVQAPRVKAKRGRAA